MSTLPLPDPTALPEPLGLDERYAHVLARQIREDGAEVYWCVRPADAEWVEVVITPPHPPIETRDLSPAEARIADSYMPTSPLAVATAGALDASGYAAEPPGRLSPRLVALVTADPSADLPTSDAAPAAVSDTRSLVHPVAGCVSRDSGGVRVLSMDEIVRRMG